MTTCFNNKYDNDKYKAEYYGGLIEEIRKIRRQSRPRSEGFKNNYPEYTIHEILTNILRMKINNKLDYFNITKTICLPDGMILKSKDFPFINNFKENPSNFIRISNFKDVENEYYNNPIIQKIKIELSKNEFINDNQGFIDDLIYSIIIHDDFDDFMANQGTLTGIKNINQYKNIMNNIQKYIDEYLNQN